MIMNHLTRFLRTFKQISIFFIFVANGGNFKLFLWYHLRKFTRIEREQNKYHKCSVPHAWILKFKKILEFEIISKIFIALFIGSIFTVISIDYTV